MSFKPIGSILSQYSPQSAIRRSVTSSLIVETANIVLKELFGPEIENLAQAKFIKNRILTIACLSTTAAAAIKMRENELYQAISDRLGVNEVARLRFLS